MARFLMLMVISTMMLAVNVTAAKDTNLYPYTKGVISTMINRVNTPGCSYGKDPSKSDTGANYPPMFLDKCTRE